MKYIFYFLISILLTGCYTEKHNIQQTATTKNHNKLDSRKSVYIAVPEDGRYGSILYHGSGIMTTQAIKMALAKHVDSIIVNNQSAEDYSTALRNAKNKNASYLFYPQIFEWEDRATEWSGKPDKVTIKIRVADVKNNKNISSIVLKSNSSWFTLGGDHPQDLIEKPISDYVNSLYN
jgi:hypothetical protein